MEIKRRYVGNYDVVRVVAFAMILIQHFFVTCVRNNIPIPAYATWIIEGGGNKLWNSRRRFVLSTFGLHHLA